MASPTPQIPTTIFSGFLGSGKTTLILPLIAHLQARHQQVVYIKNEIGQVDIDSQLARGQNIVSRELLNGCICCTLVGPFIAAIDEVAETYHPHRLIVEASGAADPAAIALMVNSHPRLKRDGVISVIDVTNFTGYADISQTARNQASFTDLIIFNKVEAASLDQKRAVVGYVRELNSQAPIVEAPHGQISPELVFGVSTVELDHLLAANHQHHDHHLTQEGLESLALTVDRPPTESELLNFLNQLPSSVFRIKGLIKLAGQADQNDRKFTIVNKVGHRIELSPASAAIDSDDANHRPITPQLVLIGFHLNADRDQILSQATSLKMTV